MTSNDTCCGSAGTPADRDVHHYSHITGVILPRFAGANVIRSIQVGLAMGCLAVLCGCGAAATSPVSPTPSSSARSVPATSSASPEGSSHPAGLVADAASAEAAKAAAIAGMTAFARVDLDYEDWWGGLSPLLSGSAVQAYRTVDPTQIPATRVIGEADLPSWDTPRIARVGVPTDAGVYLVIVSRNETDPVWRVERITPPEAR